MKAKMQIILSLTVLIIVFLGTLTITSLSYKFLLNELQKQIVKDNQAIGRQILNILAEHKLSSLSEEEQKKLLQIICNEIQLPNGGFVCAVSPDGTVFAYPGMESGEKPTMSFSQDTLSDLEQGQVRPFSDLPDDKPFTGLLARQSQTDIIAAVPIENTDIRLFVHQNRDQLSAKVKTIVRPLVLIGLGVSLILGLMTYTLSNNVVKRYEHQLEKVNANLRNANRNLEQINELLIEVSHERKLYYQAFYHSLHGMTITDAQGEIIYVNPAFEKFYGFSQEEARGENPHIINPGREAYHDLGIPTTDYDALFKEMWDKISDPEIGFWEGEIPNKKRDGSIVWVRLILNAIRNHKGEITHYIGIPIDITERRERELQIRLEIYHAITDLAEKRDNETGQHLHRVSAYSRKLAEQLKMPQKYCQDIETFSPLHDIGKVGIPDHILLAQRKLNKEEFEFIKTHTKIGYDILKDKPTLEMAADIAYSHHEKFDGSGYPRGLKGENIPLSARIIALVDVYDALRSKRPYKEPWSHEDTVKEIVSNKGKHFDPTIVDTFLQLEQEFKNITLHYQD